MNNPMIRTGVIPAHSDNVSEELSRVKHCLQTVFSTPQQQQSSNEGHQFDTRTSADKYLVSFQRQPVAWMVCDQLLLEDAENADNLALISLQNRRFFAAQTLHFKCREEVYIAQLPPGSLPSLRDSLMNNLTKFALSPENYAPLTTRLCMALSALAIQMGWTSIISDLLDNVLKPRPELGPVVLELIKLLPEEICSDRLFLAREEHRTTFRESLRTSSESILSFLLYAFNSTMNTSDQQTTTKYQQLIFKCLHSWVRYIDITPTLIQNSPLLDSTFQALYNYENDDLFEPAVDVIVEILRAYGSGPRSNIGLVEKIIPLVMNVGRQPFLKAKAEEHEDALRGYCRIFTEMGESYMSLLVLPQDLQQEQLVELVLHCSAIPEHEIANITLNFWYHFVNTLEGLEPYEFRQTKIDYYTPILLRLIQVCVSLIKYPIDIEDLQSDQAEEIDKYRFYASDTIEDCCRLLGGDVLLKNLGHRAQEEKEQFVVLSPDQQMSKWYGLEAVIFAIKSISRYIPNDENTVLPFLMDLINHLPKNVPRLRHTINVTIGRYASWLGTHPTYLNQIMPYLSDGFSIQNCTTASAIAIKQLCKSCVNQPLGDPVLQLYDGIVAANNVANTGTPIVEIKDELQILEGACLAISRQIKSDPSSSQLYIGRVIQPLLERMRAIASPESTAGPKQAVGEIERLTVIIRFLDGSPPPMEQKFDKYGNEKSTKYTLIIPLMKEAWEILDGIGLKFPSDANVAEKLCRLHKHALRLSGEKYAPILDSLKNQLVRNFKVSFQSPYLYCASICITDFSRNPQHIPCLFSMISELSTVVFDNLKTIDDFTAHPDVVEEFFYLAGRVMSYCPGPLVKSPLLNSLLQCGSVGMHVAHKNANKGTLNFLEQTVSYGVRLFWETSNHANNEESQHCKAALEKAIVAEGKPIVINLANAIMGELPLYAHSLGSAQNDYGSIPGIIWRFNELCPDLLNQWMNEALVDAPDPWKTNFLTALIKKASKDEFSYHLRSLVSVVERRRKIQS